MDLNHLIEALIRWLGLVILLTFHEWGHAWMALKCGDDTAKNEGRVSLNPLVHLDPIGTGLIPLIQALQPWMASFLIGWAKPVPVNMNNLRSPDRDDILISMAGPAMNVLLAMVLMFFGKLALVLGQSPVAELCVTLATLSLFLCFFNLLPIPPLDGSHVMRVLVRMDLGLYLQLCQYGFIVIILIMNFVPIIPQAVAAVTFATLNAMAWVVRI
jgi:Zn-dependent protease